MVTSTDRPLVVPCRGATSATELAAAVAAQLDRLGAAEASGDVDAALAAACQGRRVVALDGCASACRARLFEARGVRTWRVLNIGELAAGGETDAALLARAAADRLRRRPPPQSPARTRAGRPTGPRVPRSAPRTHDANDYLLALDALASTSVSCGAVADDAPTLAAHVSQLLGVSRPSAGEMLARLEERGLVARGAQKQVVLTQHGRLAADRVVRRHRLLERFAVDYLGYRVEECFGQALVLERGFDDDAVERLRERLGAPERCPHGWPVDPLAARAESEGLATLLALPAGSRATVARIAERDGMLVGSLLSVGLHPGAGVAIEDRERDRVVVRLDGALRWLDAESATAVLARPDGASGDG